MLTHLWLVSACALATPSVAPNHNVNDAKQWEATDSDVGAINLADDVADASSSLSEHVDRWLLHDVLVDQMAQTPDWQQALTERAELSVTVANTFDIKQRLKQVTMLTTLRGQPEQHHIIDHHRLAFDIPLAAHPLVDLYIDYFTGRGRLFFARWLQRARRFAPGMQEIMAKKGLPRDLVYVAMIESGFSPHATSQASAQGFWQFMAPTGALYGLRRDRFIDERRDFVRSTEAAATYLAQLRRSLGDWHLAWAGYNAGEGRIRRALARTHSQTFWQLIENPGVLAKETMHYVPKIIAAAIVSKDAERYGFTAQDDIKPIRYDEMQVQGALDLAVLAKASQVSLSSLCELNPALLLEMTPPGTTHMLRVPSGQKRDVSSALKALPKTQRFAYRAHTIKKGDTLIGIARKYGSDVETLRRFNAKQQAYVLKPGQELLVPSLRATSGRMDLASLSTPAHQNQQAQTWSKAQKQIRPAFANASGTTTRFSSSIKAASKLTLRPTRAGGKNKRPKARHTVAYGDTLWSIAKRYGVALSALHGRSLRGTRLAVGDIVDIF